jgi:hypothetical protein
MADEVKPTEGTEQATETGAETSTQEADERFKGIDSVDPKVLKRYVDQQVTRAIKTNEEKLSQKQKVEAEKAEQQAAIARGEFDKVKGALEAKLADLSAKLIQKDVQHSLSKHAAEAGLIDMDDLVHVVDDAVAAAVADDGSVDDAKVKSVLDEFKKSKPHKFSDGQPNAPRFRGAATPATQRAEATGPAFGPDSTDAWIKQRNDKLKELKRPAKPRNTIDLIAEAVARRSQAH